MFVAASCLLFALAPPAAAPSDRSALAAGAARIIEAELGEGQAFEILSELCLDIGHRLSGSESAARAVDWAHAKFREFGLDARKQPILVPKWVRGEPEVVEIVAPEHRRLRALALGGSIATPKEGVQGRILAVRTFEELREKAPAAKGKIVLFTKAMGRYRDPGEGAAEGGQRELGYGDVVPQRTQGAIEAAKVGAIASVIRSVGTTDQTLPHTGMMRYEDGVPKIPHVAIAGEDCLAIEQMLDRGEPVEVRIVTSCRDEGEVPSFNVIGELKGRELPDEIVVIGGHLDSWDVGHGAHDDGVGIVACMEAVRLLKALGMQPRRTIRCVAFMNEENGLAGGTAYAADHAGELSKHVAALEMDGGALRAVGLGVTAGEGGLAVVQRIAAELEAIDAGSASEGGGGADIGPMRPAGVPMLSMRAGGDYFALHHTDADRLDRVDRAELAKCSAVVAVTAWWLAEMDETLPRLPPLKSGERGD